MSWAPQATFSYVSGWIADQLIPRFGTTAARHPTQSTPSACLSCSAQDSSRLAAARNDLVRPLFHRYARGFRRSLSSGPASPSGRLPTRHPQVRSSSHQTHSLKHSTPFSVSRCGPDAIFGSNDNGSIETRLQALRCGSSQLRWLAALSARRAARPRPTNPPNVEFCSAAYLFCPY